ncbi:MAG TPA: hypothetical protein PKK07_02475, partial [bacterium]|nr:hypothetical protein [bacterium]
MRKYKFILGDSETCINPERGIFQNTLEVLIKGKVVYSTRQEVDQILIQFNEGLRRILESNNIDVTKWRGLALEAFEDWKTSLAKPGKER